MSDRSSEGFIPVEKETSKYQSSTMRKEFSSQPDILPELDRGFGEGMTKNLGLFNPIAGEILDAG